MNFQVLNLFMQQKKHESDNVNKLLNFTRDGILGLTPSGDSYESSYGENFIKQLWKEHSIKRPEFYFSFDKNNSGYFIVGTLPSKNDDYYKRKYFYEYYYDFKSDKGVSYWRLYLEKHFLNNKEIANNYYIKISSDKTIYNFPEIVLNRLKRKFFQKYIDDYICFEESNYIYCEDNIDLTKFPKMKITIKSLYEPIILNQNDLLYKENNKYYLK